MERAHLIAHGRGGAGKVDAGFVLVDLFRVRHAIRGLGGRRQRACRQGVERLDDQARAHIRQRVVQFARRHVGADFQLFFQHHVTGIEARVHLHDGDAGLRVARFDGALNGRRTAPARQQGRVDVETAVGGRIQDRLGQNQAVSHHHGGV